MLNKYSKKELGAFCHGTGNDGRGGGTEYGLEDQSNVQNRSRLADNAVSDDQSKPPKNALAAPNMMPKPRSQKIGVPMQKSIRFFMMMLPAFFARVKPVSTMAKPACMKNTSAARNKRPAYVHRRSKLPVISIFNNPLEIEMACTLPLSSKRTGKIHAIV